MQGLQTYLEDVRIYNIILFHTQLQTAIPAPACHKQTHDELCGVSTYSSPKSETLRHVPPLVYHLRFHEY